MANERCPSCAAVVRAGDPWCTLCWTDLRPTPTPPPPPPPPPEPAPVVAAPVLVAVPAAVDPLTAPLAAVLGEPVPTTTTNATWPCVQCGAANALDLDRCGTCTTPFGGRIARIDDARAQRRRVLLCALGAVGVFLLLLAAVTFTSTDAPPANPAPVSVDVSQTG